METPLLRTKLHVPYARSGLVNRARLWEKLARGLEPGCKLTLISAPAGFGKTTLLSNWIPACDVLASGRFAWLTLDADDNYLNRFWIYFVSALQMIEPGIGKLAMSALQSAPKPNVESVLASLINDLIMLDAPLALVLDDYHTINEIDIHNALGYFVQHCPEQVHLIVGTREDPPLPLSRLRVRGQMIEVRAKDLRFSVPEMEVFLNQRMSLGLVEQDIDALENRTEGWAAGLQLVALSLKDTHDKSKFIKDFTGSHRFLSDYLMDEVLSNLSDSQRKFLWRTSILDRFCAELCNAMVDTSDSEQVLDVLERSNYFLVSLDNEGHWFRYHHLFADCLRLRLFENEPELVSDLYQSAIAWFIQAGVPRDAVTYALKAGDYDQAAMLILSLVPNILERDNHMLVIRWLEALPETMLQQTPWLCVYFAWAWVIAAQMDKANYYLDLADNSVSYLPAGEQEQILGHIAVHRAYIIFMQGEYITAIDHAERALALLPLNETALRARTLTTLGNAYNYSGRLEQAKVVFREAIALARAINSISLAMFGYGSLGEVLRDQGRLAEAKQTYHDLLNMAEAQTGSPDSPLTGYAHFEIGVILRERYDLEAALAQMQKGVTLCRQWRQGEALAIGLLELAETHRIRGEFDQADTAIKEVRKVALVISPWAMNLVEGFAARLALSQGDTAVAMRWAEQSGLDMDACEIGYERFPECIPLIRLQIATGQPDRALELSDRLISRDRSYGRWGRVLDLLLLKVVALDAQKNPHDALDTLNEAVTLATAEGHIHPFVEAGSELVPYLRKLPQSPFCTRLLTILKGRQDDILPVSSQPLDGAVDLNEREIQILRYMAAGLSNREIGEALFLSVNTIRWYASQVYQKLDVKRRGEAVARAQDLDIL